MGAVFISYRRGDSEGQARALFNELADLIGRDSVFMDVDSIALGRDFRQILQERLGSSDLMLALIGPDWLDIRDASGNRRLESAADFVRQEIAAALRRNIPVTPVLVRGAQMPAPERLPDDLKDLAYRNGFELSHTRWESDVREMIKRLGLAKGDVQESRQPVTVTEGADRPVVARSSGSEIAGRPLSSKTIAIGVGATLLVAASLIALLVTQNPPASRSVLPEAVAAGQRVAIVNANSNLCATIAGGGTANNTEAVQYLCDEDPSRFWQFAVAEGSDIVQIKNVNSGLCLTVAGGNTERNTPSVQYPCDTHPSRRWRVTRVDNETFRLVNVNSNLCLTVAGGGRDRNTTLVQYPCDGDPSRDWRFRIP